MAVARPTSRRRSVLALLLVTAITLITLDLRESDTGVVASVRGVTRDAVAPVQDGLGSVISPVTDWFEGVISSGEIKRENEKLKQELAEARNDAARGRAAVRENEQLNSLLALDFIGDIPTVSARVVGTAVGNFDNTVELDRGTDSGIKVGMPVVVGQGLVGRVVTASRLRSTVILLTDSESGVGVRLERSSTLGVAKGESDHDEMQLVLVNPDVDVVDGEMVMTSGVEGARFPGGIPVATVSKVGRDPGAIQQKIVLEPMADLSQLEIVNVLLWQPVGG